MESSEYNKYPKNIILLVLLVMLNKQYLANKGKDQFGRKVNVILSFPRGKDYKLEKLKIEKNCTITYC